MSGYIQSYIPLEEERYKNARKATYTDTVKNGKNKENKSEMKNDHSMTHKGKIKINA